jgi:hypothetical protein
MESKTLIWLGMIVGSTAGGFIPLLWGAGLFSFSSIVFNALGGIAGIWFAFRLNRGY